MKHKNRPPLDDTRAMVFLLDLCSRSMAIVRSIMANAENKRVGVQFPKRVIENIKNEFEDDCDAFFATAKEATRQVKSLKRKKR